MSKDNPGVCGGHFAYVEVDTYTGMVKILDYLAVQDARSGHRPVRSASLRPRAHLLWAPARLRTEHVHYRPNGVPFANLKDYHLLNSFEAPSVRVELIENHNTEGPFRKTIGEVCHVPASAAVVGAVNDALQSDLNDLPLTPDKITAYLKNREER